MTLIDDMRSLSRELMTDPDFKQGDVSLIVITPGSGPVDDPGEPSEASYLLPGAAVRGAEFKYVARSLAVATDKQVTTPMHDGVPIGTDRDFMEIDGKRYKIVGADPKPSSGVPVVVTYVVR